MTNLAVAVSVAIQVCLVAHPAHPAVAAVLVASVVVSAHSRLALAVGPLVELVVVATVESVAQVQVALLARPSGRQAGIRPRSAARYRANALSNSLLSVSYTCCCASVGAPCPSSTCAIKWASLSLSWMG